jgi:peptide/nickel transport system substrate-binding protein
MFSSGWPRHARRAGLVACVAAVLAILAGCGGGSGSSGDAKLLKLGTTNTVDSLNPFVGVQLLTVEFTHLMYPFLVEYDANAKLIPALAKSWTFSNGSKTLTLKLVTGGKWSDGKPLTAKDAAFTLNTLVKYGSGPAGLLWGYVQSLKDATAQGDATLVLNFKSPTPQAVSELSFVPILPQHVWAKYATGDGAALTKFRNNAPVVSGGPFALMRYQSKQFAIFDRNDGFYGTKPRVARIGYTIFSSPDALVNSLQSGDVDAAEQAPPSLLSTLKNSDVTIQDPVSFSELWVMINDSAQGAVHAELHNPKVRQAFDLAIDRNRIVQTAYFGEATPGSSLVPPSLPDYHEDTPAPAFDIAKANALLDEAGYKRGAGGIRQASGHPMSYRFVEFKSTGGPEDPAAQVIKHDFAKLGVKLDVAILDVPAAIAALMDKHYTTFDMGIVTFTGSYDPSNVLGSLTCQTLTSFNPNGHCDKAFDAIANTLAALPDGPQRIAAVKRLQQMMDQNGSLLTVAYSKDIYAYRNDWAGFTASPNGWFWGTQTSTKVGRK